MSIGILWSNYKKNERRLPIHPDHFENIPQVIANQLIFESGYGRDFGISDQDLQTKFKVLDKQEIWQEVEGVLITKPTADDVLQLRKGQFLWGWPHCVQGKAITQAAIDRQVTLIAWEAMNQWSTGGDWLSHEFFKNNEIAGYAAVLDACQLQGVTGLYGAHKKAIVIGSGSVAKGAIEGLKALSIHSIQVIAPRIHGIPQTPGIDYLELQTESNCLMVKTPHALINFKDMLFEADIIVNAILQNPNEPLEYLTDEDIPQLKKRSLIIDVSCDEAMGFSFAKPTTMDQRTFAIGQTTYYGVDHTPSIFWDSTSYELSKVVLRHLPTILAGASSWHDDPCISKAIEIENGKILNQEILKFQCRAQDYPYEIQA